MKKETKTQANQLSECYTIEKLQGKMCVEISKILFNDKHNKTRENIVELLVHEGCIIVLHETCKLLHAMWLVS